MHQEIIIDWLQFTVHETTYVEVIDKLLQMQFSLFKKLPKGKMGYRNQVFFENISILYEGLEGMGVHVIISGQGCRYYEQHKDLLDLIQRLNWWKAKTTRIDLALDDKKGDLLPFNNLLRDAISGNVSSIWKTNTETITRDMNGNTLGRMIVLGKRTSNTFIRIYNKRLEQEVKARNRKDDKAIEDLPKTWYRMELEIKKSNAEELVKVINKKNTGILFSGIIKNYVRFLVPNKTDTNKSRWKTRRYWKNLTDNVEKISLTRKGEMLTIDDKKLWLEKQVGQTLATVSLADGSVDFVYDLIKENSIKLKNKNKILLQEHEKEQERLKKEYLGKYGGNTDGK